MEHVEKSINVDVPVHVAYDQWTQFEDFPKFMEGVKEVHQLDDKRLHWRAVVAGKEKDWNAEITEQVPDQRIAWHSTSGTPNAGLVTFFPEGDHTRISLRMDYDPQGIVENAGDAMGFVGRQVEGDLKRFKEFIESQSTPTGGWRGEIHGDEVKHRTDETHRQTGESEL